ncbi:hypothetical protein [Pseudofulvimonas gallinarii]|uniref:Dolichyl-phosphate-mannose-protein mannosyltransferase n=2 Tax=Pseudofulvimonas gallinarii TaxID=634155 RepID=A0A4R3LCE2_9GAMM|nr:hypothetical protein [Pseudofulvimonas gallinarii]TCS95994.1 hypothetical protein EDC25_1174 [Pseudofulvimonas gallinarii]
MLLRSTLGLLALLTVVLVIYLPVRDAGYVWDDFAVFEQRGWLYKGDEWKQYLFTGFNDWQYYFRPLVVGLFVLQARLFEGAPEPMHLVTLGMQLINVALVFLLARRVAVHHRQHNLWLPLFAGVFFGLHPMLVETVVWIGCQFDQVQVMFALLGLVASLGIERRWLRAAVVSLCFFVSACAKESAALYPVIIVVLDWLMRSDRNDALIQRARNLWVRNWPVYVCLALTGVTYLLLRHVTMGSLLGGIPVSEFVPSLARIDEIAYVYLKYWMVVAGIPFELSPIHPVEGVVFGQDLTAMPLRILGALAVLAIGLLVFSRRFAFTGAVVAVASAYLFPVLGFFPGHFDGSLYHERYAIGAIAVTAVLLPGVINEWRPAFARLPLLRKFFGLLAILWVAWAALNVRVTIPLWSSDVALWRWASERHPDNAMVKGNLISNLTALGRVSEVRHILNDALTRNLDCDICYLNGFSFSVSLGDRPMAEILRDRLSRSSALGSDRIVTYSYYLFDGFLELRNGNLALAESLLRRSLSTEAESSFTHVLLTETLVALERAEEAQHAAKRAVETAYPPDAAGIDAITARILLGEQIYSAPMVSGPIRVRVPE